MLETITCENLDQAIERYVSRGYRLDMIFPADDPREALVSRDGEQLRLRAENHPVGETPTPLVLAWQHAASASPRKDGKWIKGRAGMEYRDLIPGRLDGKVIASHIRLTTGGKVPDYVHYHKIDFQMIYCVKGRIKLVYEDQGEPFWLETGDCVLQPPEIRHRVLECTAGAEVIEVSMPAEHETWVEHEITLPTTQVKPDRYFRGQRFVRHVAATSNMGTRDTGISAATNGFADVRIIGNASNDELISLTLGGLGSEGDGLLPAPISLEIAI